MESDLRLRQVAAKKFLAAAFCRGLLARHQRHQSFTSYNRRRPNIGTTITLCALSHYCVKWKGEWQGEGGKVLAGSFLISFGTAH